MLFLLITELMTGDFLVVTRSCLRLVKCSVIYLGELCCLLNSNRFNTVGRCRLLSIRDSSDDDDAYQGRERGKIEFRGHQCIRCPSHCEEQIGKCATNISGAIDVYCCIYTLAIGVGYCSLTILGNRDDRGRKGGR